MARIFGGRRVGRRHTEQRRSIEVEPEGESELDPDEEIARESVDPPSPKVDCKRREQLLRIEILIREADGGPLDGVLVRLAKAEDETTQDVTEDGEVSFGGLRPRSYQIILPGIDAKLCTLELDRLKYSQIVDSEPMWTEPEDPLTVSEVDAESGDCLASLAFEFGTSLDAMIAANSEIDDPHLLTPGMEITVPEIEPFTSQVSAGRRFIITVAVPRVLLRLYMETYGLEARPGVPFRLQVFDDDWTELDGSEGTTGDRGLIEVSTQASARHARLRLQPEDGEIEQYNLAIGELEPSDSDNGLRARLNDLAFYCGDEPPPSSGMEIDDQVDPALQAALDAFARSFDLGEDPERDALEEAIRSNFGC